MSGFGFSVGDIVLGIKVLAKIGKAFHSTAGSAAKYRDAVTLLQSLKTTLDCITTYSQEHGDDFYADNIVEQLEHIKPPWEAFNEFLGRFESLLGKDRDHLAMRKTRRTIEYALRDLDGEVDRLKLAITQPLQVINVFLTLQATQNTSFESKRHATHRVLPEFAQPPVECLHSSLRTELEKMQATQSAQMASLISVLQSMAVHDDRRLSIDTVPSCLDSSLGTEISSIFSAREGSLYTMTDADSVLDHDDKMALPCASGQPIVGRRHARFAVHGYRRLSAREQRDFLVPGRLFLTMQSVPTSAMHYDHTIWASEKDCSHPSGQPGVTRYLVIHNEGTHSLCVRVHRWGLRKGSVPEGFGPYEVPLSATTSDADDPNDIENDSMTLQMREANEGPTSQLPPHSFVRLRDFCTVQNNVKLMNMGALTGDDRNLLVALWHDANESIECGTNSRDAMEF